MARRACFSVYGHLVGGRGEGCLCVCECTRMGVYRGVWVSGDENVYSRRCVQIDGIQFCLW